ncbi:AER402Cp [Eremothecium gossypii ATCC 10895]|uniref:AER402Cp n=1 Tax=Eremothecium gossypii (strain ATCC 10895 / CBS 109.51 / FGSC 9923 / NRRL Y-1056) TaxID=284811 RepID=Q755W6_EREGS|nr:AER402Cp [Eremothecium gossypii ATCC 10895]AAS53081.1 AER402Cp [Eremothecium gossypii ATCC 10895]AEY97390.1 FAER402Cp [Eremothecium gossypii FDAG1]
MWVFKCNYQKSGQLGALQNISCALCPEREFIVGRASKSTLVIEEKGVSRTHLRLEVIDDHVNILLLGSQLKVGGEDASKGSVLPFGPSQSPVILEVGSHSVQCILEWAQWEFKVPNTLLQEDPALLEVIKGLGIRVVTSFSKATTHHIIRPHEDDQDYEKYLFALVKGIPILHLEFLKQFTALLRQPVTDFDPQLRSIQEQHYAFRGFTKKAADLNGLHFIVNRKHDFEMLKYTLEIGGGTVHFCHDINDLSACLKTIPINGALALKYDHGISAEVKKVDDTRYCEVLHSHGIQLFTVHELTKAILYDKLAQLLSKRPPTMMKLVEPVPSTISQTQEMKQESLSPISLGNTTIKDLPRKDKTRKRLKKPQPLDSLSFFAGGLSRQNSSIGGTADLVKQESMSLGADTHYGSPNDVQSLPATQSPKKRRRPKVEPLGNLMTSQLQKAFDDPTISSAKVSPTEQEIIPVRESQAKKTPDPIGAFNGTSQKGSIESNSRKRQPSPGYPYEPLPAGVGNGDILNKQWKSLDEQPPSKKPRMQETDLYSEVMSGSSEEYREELTRSKLNSLDEESIKSRKRTSSEKPVNSCKRRQAPAVPEQNIVDAIKQIKEREVNRIRTTIVELGPEELTEDAIRQLKSLAIVQPVDMLRQQHTVDTVGSSPLTFARKNYKNFKKVWPKYMNRKNSPETRNATAISNRKYLPLELYETDLQSRTLFEDGAPPRQKDNISRSTSTSGLSNDLASNRGKDHPAPGSLFSNHALLGNDNAGPEPIFNFSSRSREDTNSPTASPAPNLTHDNTLFVVDDENEDGDGMADTSIAQRVSRERHATTKPAEPDTAEPRHTRRKHAPRPSAAAADSDEDGEPTFAFKRAR